MDTSEQERLRNALDELLASGTFRRSPALERLLTHLVERVLADDVGSLKEAVIGHELYGRPAGYDPKLDSVVRVSANRLRLRLQEHYRLRRAAEPRLVLPRGTYVPRLEILGPADPVDATTDVQGSAVYDSTPGAAAAAPLAAAGFTEPQQGSPGRLRTGAGRAVVLASLVSVLLFATAAWVYLRGSNATASSRAGASVRTTWSVRPFARMGGSQQFSSFSPDGRHLAFTSTTSGDGNKAIYVQAIGSEEARRVAAGVRPAWSPDNRSLAFLRPLSDSRKQVILYDIASGKENVVAELQGASPWLCQIPRLTWSRTGDTLYAAASSGGNAICGLVAINLATHRVTPVLQTSGPIGDLEPAVSPDGTKLAWMRGLGSGASDLFIVGIRGGEIRRVTHDGTDIIGFDWSSDGKALLVASNREGGLRKLWRMPVDGGQPEPLTDGSSLPTFPAASGNGTLINFTEFHVTAPLWRVRAGTSTEIVNNQSKNSNPSISPDGLWMLYTSDRAGRTQVWLSRSDGTGSRPLLPTGNFDTAAARWSPNGRSVVMECHLAKQTHLCVANADGSGVRQVTGADGSQVSPSWSRDSRAIYYTQVVAGRPEIFRMLATGGPAEAWTHKGGSRALESIDGKWLYVVPTEYSSGLVALPLSGSQQQRALAEAAPILPHLQTDIASGWDVCKAGVVYLAHNGADPPRLDLFDAQTKKTKLLLPHDRLDGAIDVSLGALPNSCDVVFSASHSQSSLSMMSAQP